MRYNRLSIISIGLNYRLIIYLIDNSVQREIAKMFR